MKMNTPHALGVKCSYEIRENKTKVVLPESKFEGWITFDNGKSKLKLPMRSFVRAFLDRIQQILAGENTSDITKLSSASAGATGSLADKHGILIGTRSSPISINDTALDSQHASNSQCQHKATVFTAPYSPNDSQVACGLSRLFTNASTVGWTITEAGIKTKKTASGASNAGLILISRDAVSYTLNPSSDVQVWTEFTANKTATGGILINFMRLVYNLYLKGNANASPFLPRSGTVSVTHPSASATSFFVADAASSKLWGIVVGYHQEVGIFDPDSIIPERITPSIPADANTFNIVTTGLSYGAVTVSAVTISGNRAYFTISRDISNSGTTAKTLDRIGLLTKGATANPSSLQPDQVFLVMNKPDNNETIVLQPNQTLRVEYTLEIQA